ncbi:hypothetical protein SDC9_47220 [bioreactor metagenome]|uniref:Bacterial bifunctional deaminase-reductase C-terminal domain-containing protein n=1 Tax=bioreactor metagenome TaxID=1076179 RepID=A0A644WEN3_9ZZZZ
MTYEDTRAHVLEVLTEKAGNAYKAFLRRLGISYIIAGGDALDCALVMGKVKRLFGVETLMLGGGAVLNWSFIQAGLCDELSVVMAASADGSPETPALFKARDGMAADPPVRFDLKSAEVKDAGSLWLRYTIKK